MKKTDWLCSLREIAENVCNRRDFELYDLEVHQSGKRWLLRVTIDSIDKPVTIDDCERISKEISSLLDIDDPIPHSYTLEVSSPGLERKLRNTKDFERFKGERVKIVLNEDIEEVKGRVLEGIIMNVENEDISIEIDDGSRKVVPFFKIKKANLVFRFGK